MAGSITYREKLTIAVFANGQRVGTIRPCVGGWRYQPLGAPKKQASMIYASPELVKASLEGRAS